MQYVPFGQHGFQVSRLGMGMMRLPTREEDSKKVIDREAAIALVRHGVDQGVSYVDTAYGYHNGESEIVTGLALKDGYREKVTLTTKLPLWLVEEEKDMNRLLDEQLRKLDVPYVDFYILHAVSRDRFHKMQAFHYQDFLRQASRTDASGIPAFPSMMIRTRFWKCSGILTAGAWPRSSSTIWTTTGRPPWRACGKRAAGACPSW